MRQTVDIYRTNCLYRKRARNVVFSDHAISRIYQRCKIKLGKLQIILEKDICVNVGKDNEGCTHYLFYEPYSMRHFVAIGVPAHEDNYLLVVKTVLELIIHETLSWPVSEKQLYMSASLNRKYFMK